MGSAFDDLGGKPETFAEIYARSLAGQAKAPVGADEIEAKARLQREYADRHDAMFSAEYVDIGGQRLSCKLASHLGYDVEPADNGGDMGMIGNPDPSPPPAREDWDE